MSYSHEAQRLVLGDRNASYGPPKDDYAKTAKIWSGLLMHKLRPGVEIAPEDALLMMVGLKLSREMFKHKPDNIIDAHGYLICYELCVRNLGIKEMRDEISTLDKNPFGSPTACSENSGTVAKAISETPPQCAMDAKRP